MDVLVLGDVILRRGLSKMLGLWKKFLEPECGSGPIGNIMRFFAANLGSVAAVASGDFRLRERFDMILRSHHATVCYGRPTAVAQGF